MTWKQLIAGLVAIIVAVAIVVGVLSSCGGHHSPEHRGATRRTDDEHGRGLGETRALGGQFAKRSRTLTAVCGS